MQWTKQSFGLTHHITEMLYKCWGSLWLLISAKLLFYSPLLYVTKEKKTPKQHDCTKRSAPHRAHRRAGTACSTKLQGSSAPRLEHLLSSLFSDIGICRAAALTFFHSCLTKLLLCFVVVLILNPFSKTYS